MIVPLSRVGRMSVLLLLLATLLPATVAVRPSQNNVLNAVPAPGPVVLDGKLDDWDTSGEMLLCDDLDAPVHAVRVAAMYDATGVYLAFRFFDVTPLINHVDPLASPAQGWCGDAVQLRWWCDTDKPLGPPDGGRILHLDCYWYTDGKRPTAYATYGSFQPGYAIEKTIPEAIGHGVAAAFLPQADGRGYTQEMRIDWALLRRDGRAYHAGESLRLGIETFWGDAESRQKPAFRVVDLNDPAHPQRDSFWMNHQAWGTLAFVDRGHLAPTAGMAEWPRIEQALAKVTVTEEPTLPPAVTPPAADKPNQPYLGDMPAGKLVNDWFHTGSAAGNVDDWYDNRDRGHSLLDLHAFPQLQLQDYTAQERRDGDDWGATRQVRPRVLVGNSSTSDAPEESGSNPRSLYCSQAGMAALYAQYRGNNLHVYPEHRDYDPGRNGRVGCGDLLPANTPYLLISQGSSGSDQPFLSAVMLTLAAFPPEVKRVLVERGLLMPTVQEILRRAYAGTPAEYLTGAANPVVFDGARLDPVRMVEAAQAMRVDTIPPMIQLRVAHEAPPRLQPLTRSEQLCDTPVVIGRVHRRLDRDLQLTVSAQDSFDVTKRPLTFRWVVLQGDPTRIKIKTHDHGAVADITIGWHGRFSIAPGSAMQSNRVDIGVFASNGAQYSAPGFVTVYYPDNDLRTYDARGWLIDRYDAAGDTTIGFDTQALLPTGDVPTYDITDWLALFDCALGTGNNLPGQLLRAHLSKDDRAVLQRARGAFQDAVAGYAAEKRRIQQDATLSYNDQLIALDKLTTTTSQPLWRLDPVRHTSAKAILERALNAVKDDPQLYLRQRDAIDALVQAAPTPANTAVTDARARLQARGILAGTPERPAWHSVRSGHAPVAQRLTQYERYEIQSFNLLLMSRVLYPQFLAGQPRLNVFDHRLATSDGSWLVGQYSAAGRFTGLARREDTK